VNRGAIHAQSGFLREAAEDFEKAVELSPENADIHYNLGLLYTDMNSFEKALAAFEKALQLKPSDKSAKQQVEGLKARLNPSGLKGR
jgi:tetratricopeptide (TPR) repeat protein